MRQIAAGCNAVGHGTRAESDHGVEVAHKRKPPKRGKGLMKEGSGHEAGAAHKGDNLAVAKRDHDLAQTTSGASHKAKVVVTLRAAHEGHGDPAVGKRNHDQA